MSSLLRLSDSSSNDAIRHFRQLIKLDMVNYILDRMASQQHLESVLMRLNSGSVTAENLIHKICNNTNDKHKLFLSIAWMIKLGLIEIEQ